MGFYVSMVGVGYYGLLWVSMSYYEFLWFFLVRDNRIVTHPDPS